MKKYLLIFTAFIIAESSFSQESKSGTPEAAKASFQKKFPNATKAKWEKENQDFEVNFYQNGKEMSAVFNASGELKETEEEIKVSDLPATIASYVKEHYKDQKIKEAAKITKANGEINYEAEVNKVDVIFDKTGKFLKEEKD